MLSVSSKMIDVFYYKFEVDKICLYEANCNLDGAMVVETKNFYDFGFALHPLCCFGDQIPVSFEW